MKFNFNLHVIIVVLVIVSPLWIHLTPTLKYRIMNETEMPSGKTIYYVEGLKLFFWWRLSLAEGDYYFTNIFDDNPIGFNTIDEAKKVIEYINNRNCPPQKYKTKKIEQIIKKGE